MISSEEQEVAHVTSSINTYLHTRTAISQFATEPNRAHVLVFNINSPAGSIPSDFLNAAAERVADLSNGDVRCEFLLHRHRIAPDNV